MFSLSICYERGSAVGSTAAERFKFRQVKPQLQQLCVMLVKQRYQTSFYDNQFCMLFLIAVLCSYFDRRERQSQDMAHWAL